MMPNRYEKYGPTLIELGYDITPVVGKKPVLKGWTDRPDSAHDCAAHGDKSIGVLLGGRHNLVAVDVDILNPFATNEIEKLVEEELGSAPKRIGRSPKFLMVFRCAELQRKQKTGLYHIDNADAAVEILGEGQQFVASGIHPDTKKKYYWPGDNLTEYRPQDLTEVTPDALRRFLARASRIMGVYGPLKGRVSDRAPQPRGGLNLKELTADEGEIIAALAHIPNNDEHYDDWVQTAHAIKGALGDDGFDLFCEWSARSDKDDAAQNERLWRSIGKVTSVGAGSIFHWAGEHGFDLQEVRGPKFDGPEDTKLDRAPEPADEPDHVGMIRAADIKGPVPDQKWLLHDWFPTRAVSLLSGQGGVGKTLLMHQMANCVVNGRDFLGIPTRKMPVVAVLCEDDRPVIRRRQLSINAWLGADEIGGEAPRDLFIWPRVGEDNIIVTFPNQGEDKAGKFYQQIVERVEYVKKETGADEILLILDTATDLFGGNENIRREVNTFIKTYVGSFCENHNATVVLLSHPSLAGLSSGSGLSGSTAWENSVRSRAYFSRGEGGDDIRTLSRKKSNYSSSGEENDIVLLWDAGVYQLPATPDQVDRIEKTSLKNDILTEIEAAYIAKNPYTKQGNRSHKSVIFANNFGRKPAEITRLINDLEAEGCLSYDRCWKVEKLTQKWTNPMKIKGY